MAFKISNELKIGILVTTALVVLILGFNFLRGKGAFSTDIAYHTYYDNVGGLTEAANVLLQGLKVGKVAAIELQPDHKVKVTFLLKKDVKLYEGVVAVMNSDNLLAGTKVINLVFPEQAPAQPTFIEEDGFIPSEPSSDMMGEITNNIKPILGTANKAVSSLDSILLSINHILNDDARVHINQSLKYMEATMKDLSTLANALNKQTNNLAGVLQNANNITGNLAKSNEQISGTLNNLNDFSGQLKNAPIEQTLKELRNTAESLNQIMAKLNDKNGSLGLMVNDPKLYNNLSGSLESLDILLEDLKKHPSKYINISVFGKKAAQ